VAGGTRRAALGARRPGAGAEGAGLRLRVAALLPYLGPAFVASIAYVDPGNFATNIAAGSLFGYDLLWVILAANLVAILVQSLAARLGIASGRTLPEWSRLLFPRGLNRFLWAVAELGAMATDLAELTGAALGLHLLLHMALLPAAALAAALTLGLLALERRGYRLLEQVIIAFLGVIAAAYVWEAVRARPDPAAVLGHLLLPRLARGELPYAAGIFGATVMPHVVYLHTALVLPRRRAGADPEFLGRREQLDVLVAMNLAFVVNASLLVMAAAAFGARGLAVLDLAEAHRTLEPLFGRAAAAIFALGLLASGLASSVVGTLAGQTILEGFVEIRLPLPVRRLLTLLPAALLLGAGVDPLQMLLWSQVVLSFALPFALGPLLLFNASRHVMGRRVAPLWLTLLAGAVTLLVVVMDGALLLESLPPLFRR
jgi:manganese transport protein